MSGKDIALIVQDRTIEGKAVKQLRRDGLIPAVIHDHGKPSKIIMVPTTQLKKVYKDAGKHHPLALTLGKEQFTALIKDVDFDPKLHQIRHVVFNAIKQDEMVETEVPLVLEGDIPAEKVGLLVIIQLDSVEIEALPRNLVDQIKVDVTGLVEIGDKITVADIKVPEGVTILTEPEHPIVTVEEPKAQISEEESTEAEAAGESSQEVAAESSGNKDSNQGE